MTTAAITLHNVARIDIRSQRDLGMDTVTRDIVIVTDNGDEFTIELFAREQDTIKVEIN